MNGTHTWLLRFVPNQWIKMHPDIYRKVSNHSERSKRYKICAETTQFGHFFAYDLWVMLGWLKAVEGYEPVYPWETMFFEMEDLVWMVLYFNHFGSDGNKVGIKPTWAFMLSCMTDLQGPNQNKVRYNVEINSKPRVTGGIFLNSLMLCRQSKVPFRQ